MSAISIKRKNGDIIHLTEVVRYGKDFINSVTNNPVENGSKIADHVQSENARFSINGYIAWTDITNQTGITAGKNVQSQTEDVTILGQKAPTLFGGGEVYRALKAIRDNKELVDIIETSVRSSALYNQSGTDGFTLHQNCILTSLSFDEDSETGDGTNVSLSFEQIRLVTLREVVVKVPVQSKGNGDKGTNKGNKTPSKAGGNAKPSTNPAAQGAKTQDKGELGGGADNLGKVWDAGKELGDRLKFNPKKDSYFQ